MTKQLRVSIGTHTREPGEQVKLMLEPYDFFWLACNTVVRFRRNGKHFAASLSTATFGEMVWHVNGQYLGIVSSEIVGKGAVR